MSERSFSSPPSSSALLAPNWQGRPSAFASRLARLALRLIGWRPLNVPAPSKRAIIVVYPHTSNFDFPPGMLWAWAVRAPVRFVAKAELFRGPLGAMLRSWGGLAVNRHASGNFVQAVAALVQAQDEVLVAVTPEGTRRRTEGWRSGFYHMARAAGVPLALATVDWKRREVGVFAYLETSDDMAADFARLKEAYKGREGKHPERQAPIAPMSARAKP